MLDKSHVHENVHVAHKFMENQKALAPAYKKVHKYAQNTETHAQISHLQLLHSVFFNIYHPMQTDTECTPYKHSPPLCPFNLLVYLCVVVLCFLFSDRGCVPRSPHLPIPPLACATLHLQGIKSEPPESTEKKDKKIVHNENQKHRLFLYLLLSLPPLPWTWKDERGGELNLIQTSSPQRLWRLWSVSVRVWAFCSLILSPLSRSPQFFLWTDGESLEALQFNHLLTGLMSTTPSKGQSLYFLLKQASSYPLVSWFEGFPAFWCFSILKNCALEC